MASSSSLSGLLLPMGGALLAAGVAGAVEAGFGSARGLLRPGSGGGSLRVDCACSCCGLRAGSGSGCGCREPWYEALMAAGPGPPITRILPWRRSWQLASGCAESSLDCGWTVGLGRRRLLERARVDRPGGRAEDDEEPDMVGPPVRLLRLHGGPIAQQPPFVTAADVRVRTPLLQLAKGGRGGLLKLPPCGFVLGSVGSSTPCCPVVANPQRTHVIRPRRRLVRCIPGGEHNGDHARNTGLSFSHRSTTAAIRSGAAPQIVAEISNVIPPKRAGQSAAS